MFYEDHQIKDCLRVYQTVALWEVKLTINSIMYFGKNCYHSYDLQI
jgi:hypothetical protein